MKCVEECKESEIPCNNRQCRYNIKYEDDLNCTFVAIEKKGKLTLREIGERLDISFVRVKQIEAEVLHKLKKRLIKNGVKSELFRNPDH